MLKKTIKYDGFDGEVIEEDYYFHLNEAEITKMKLEHGVGFEDHLKSLLRKGEPTPIIEAFEMIISKTVGRRVGTVNGDRFVKDAEFTKAFMSSDAYSALFMELASSPNAATEFIRGVLTKKMQDQIDANEAATQKASANTQAALAESTAPQFNLSGPTLSGVLAETTDLRPAWQRENRTPTQEELLKMSPGEFAEYAKARSNTQ